MTLATQILSPARSSSIFSSVRILVLTASDSLATALLRSLRDRGGDALQVSNRNELISELNMKAAHAVVLDVGHQLLSAIPITQDVRLTSHGEATTIFVVARVPPNDPAILRLLREGVDDVVDLPGGLPQFAARMSARLRRARSLTTTGGGIDLWPSFVADCIIAGPIEVRPASRVALIEGHPISLSASEFALLEILAQHEGEILTRDRIISMLYMDDSELPMSHRSVDSMIYLLRKRMGTHGGLIRSQRGRGYGLITG